MIQQDHRRLYSARTQIGSLPGSVGEKIWLWYRSQLWLGSDPWPKNSTCHAVPKKEKKKIFFFVFLFFLGLLLRHMGVPRLEV